VTAHELRLVQGGNVLVDLWNRMVKYITWPDSCGDDEECLYFGPEAA